LSDVLVVLWFSIQGCPIEEQTVEMHRIFDTVIVKDQDVWLDDSHKDSERVGKNENHSLDLVYLEILGNSKT
jgi:hypothetical protein